MYKKKKNKICPFCRSKVKKMIDNYKCEHCGEIIKAEVLDTSGQIANFFNGRR